ncbi:uncharacterized protein B0P05DRAFT_573592, partial [Gilbertella persicaria]|uniref:uncharacterized protein n=1 Tax=Gilbertella persicaria TaxID=101096 RepID=UPI00221F6E25
MPILSAIPKRRRVVQGDEEREENAQIPIQVPQNTSLPVNSSQQIGAGIPQVASGNTLPGNQNPSGYPLHNIPLHHAHNVPLNSSSVSNNNPSQQIQQSNHPLNNSNIKHKQPKKRKPVRYLKLHESTKKILSALSEANSGLSILDWV